MRDIACRGMEEHRPSRIVKRHCEQMAHRNAVGHETSQRWVARVPFGFSLRNRNGCLFEVFA